MGRRGEILNIRLAGVVGAGTMGHGIAQVLICNGYSVVLHDATPELVGRGAEKISSGLSRDLEKGRLTVSERQQAESRLKTTIHLPDLAPADIVIEAVTENLRSRRQLFRSLEEICRPEALFASNTSSISITRLAGVTGRPAKFVGLHFSIPCR